MLVTLLKEFDWNCSYLSNIEIFTKKYEKCENIDPRLTFSVAPNILLAPSIAPNITQMQDARHRVEKRKTQDANATNNRPL